MRMKRIAPNWFKRAVCALALPLVEEWPLFVTCFCVNAVDTWRAVKDSVTGAAAPVTWVAVAENVLLYAFLAYVLTAVVWRAGRRWVKVVAYGLMVGLFIVDSYLLYNYSMHLSPSALMLLGETTWRESREFMATSVWTSGSWKAYVQALAIVAVIVMLERWRRGAGVWLGEKAQGVLGILVVVIIVAGVYASRVYVQLLGCRSTDEVASLMDATEAYPSDAGSKLLYSFYDLYLAGQEMGRAVEVNRRVAMEEATVSAECDSLTVVLVVGESYIKWHAGVYGYALPTTPFMAAERLAGRLTVFTDVVSPYNLTSPVIRNMMCCNSLGHGERWHETPFFPVVFHRAGYEVQLWDNQRGTAPGAAFTFALNRFLYDPELQTLAYSQTNDRFFDYDGDLVADFKNKSRLGTKNLVVFHLMGQHTAARDRYPHGRRFERFTADSIRRSETWLTPEKKRRIAEYDNATLYNDYVFSEIVKCFDGSDAVVVYVSDHGEEIYDYRDSEGRRRDALNRHRLEYQYEVPLMVWMSETYKKKHAATALQIARAAGRPLMTDNICQLLFHLGGVNTPYYNRERDVLESAYRCPPRRVEDSVDYDRVMSVVKAGF